eukprot:2835936-Amphidinium_carterae.1
MFKENSEYSPMKTEGVLQECCKKLGVRSTGPMYLLSGNDVVPARTRVPDWPGIRARGEISEYQLVVGQEELPCKQQ